MKSLSIPAPGKATEAWGILASSRWLWCLATVLIYLLPSIRDGFRELHAGLGDTDDATRLIQVRAWLNGAGWFDMTLPQFGGPTPLVSHWSRLIDLPLGLLLLVGSLVLPPEAAELAVRVLWPSFLLVLLLRLLVHEAEMRAGAHECPHDSHMTAVLVLALSLTCLTGLYQFRPGRIDHHNVMILATLAGLLLLARGLDNPRRAACAGAACGLALAVGFEPLALIVPVLGLLVLAGALHQPWLASACATLVALAATLSAVFLVTVAPARWLVVNCDALSLNSVALLVVAAAGVCLVHTTLAAWRLPVRLLALASVGAAALAAYVALEPACAGGPFGQVSADAARIWLAHIQESKSLWAMSADGALWVFGLVGLLAAGVWATWSRWRQLRTVESAALAVAMLSLVPAAVLMMKFHAYASWMAVFCLALRLRSVQGTAALSRPFARIAGVALLNQWSISAVALISMTALGAGQSGSGPAASTDACFRSPHIRPLAVLPPGLVVAPVNLGPYIAAWTPHRVLSAPYHRIDGAIVETIRIFEADHAAAEQRLRALNARYLVHCPGIRTFGENSGAKSSLQARLERGETPRFLERIALDGSPLLLFAVRPLPGAP